MSEKDNILINNTKAHIESLRNELSVVNHSLEDKIAELEDSIAELGHTNADVLEAQKKLNAVLSATEKEKTDSAKRVERIEQEEEKLSSEKSSFEEYKKSELLELESSRRTVQQEIDSASSELKKIRAELESVTTTLEKNKEIVHNQTADIERLQEDLHSTGVSLENLEESYRVKAKEIGNSLREKTLELQEVIDKIITYNTTFANKKSDLSGREDAITKRELNFEIMYNRLNKEFQKLHDGQELKL